MWNHCWRLAGAYRRRRKTRGPGSSHTQRFAEGGWPERTIPESIWVRRETNSGGYGCGGVHFTSLHHIMSIARTVWPMCGAKAQKALTCSPQCYPSATAAAKASGVPPVFVLLASAFLFRLCFLKPSVMTRVVDEGVLESFPLAGSRCKFLPGFAATWLPKR